MCFDNAIFSTPPGQPVWAADPSCRGTFGIISLCFSTTVICIWSAIHRDIPLYRLDTIPSLLRDAPWVLVAILCPELLVFYALNQFVVARKLVQAASDSKKFRVASNMERGRISAKRRFQSWFTRKLVQQPAPYPEGSGGAADVEQGEITYLMLLPPSSARFQTGLDPERTIGASNSEQVENPSPVKLRRYPFTLVHGFYTAMGGYAFTIQDDNGKVAEHYRDLLPTGQTRAKITVDGMLYLMEHAPDVIPDLSETSITDRSKSSSLGKAVFIVQVAWFCLNCAFRLGEYLPLSLLEVSTLAHGLCTLVLCLVWLFKPLNIDEPTLITVTEETREAMPVDFFKVLGDIEALTQSQRSH